MITVISNNKAHNFTVKTKAADFIGVTPMTLYRWQKKLTKADFECLEYHSKGKNRVFTVYFNSELVRKSDDVPV